MKSGTLGYVLLDTALTQERLDSLGSLLQVVISDWMDGSPQIDEIEVTAGFYAVNDLDDLADWLDFAADTTIEKLES